MKKLPLLFLIALFISGELAAQLTIPQASPTQTLSQNFGTSKIVISYSRPGVKGRTIFGGLVPYDSVWRTGANSATKISFGEDVELEGHKVPMGEYALYTIPGKQEWTIVLSSDTTLWGAFGYNNKSDFLRFKVKSQSVPMEETFLMDIANIKSNSCDIELIWEKTLVSFHVTADIDSKIMAQIDAAMKTDKPPYWRAAYYYFENGHDVNQAYVWVNKAIEANPDAYYMKTEKAKMEMAMGKYSDALATATIAKEGAMKADDTGQMFSAEQIMKEAKSKAK